VSLDGCRLDSSGSGLASSCKLNNEYPDFIKGGKFVDWLSDWYSLHRYSRLLIYKYSSLKELNLKNTRFKAHTWCSFKKVTILCKYIFGKFCISFYLHLNVHTRSCLFKIVEPRTHPHYIETGAALRCVFSLSGGAVSGHKSLHYYLPSPLLREVIFYIFFPFLM
jgi:hypothetical protein